MAVLELERWMLNANTLSEERYLGYLTLGRWNFGTRRLNRECMCQEMISIPDLVPS